MSKHQESFPVLSISREDVNHAVGYNLGSELTDDQMERIASKFGDALQCLEPWNILADVCDILVNTLATTRTITIELRSGSVVDIRGVPDGWDYEIQDHDITSGGK